MHAAVAHYGPFSREAGFAGLRLAQEVVGGAEQLIVVQRPHHADTLLASQLRQVGRQVGVYVVQMHYIGAEIMEQADKALAGAWPKRVRPAARSNAPKPPEKLTAGAK